MFELFQHSLTRYLHPEYIHGLADGRATLHRTPTEVVARHTKYPTSLNSKRPLQFLRGVLEVEVNWKQELVGDGDP